MLRQTLLALALLAPVAAQAGQACTDARPSPEAVRKALTLGLQTRDALQREDPAVALIARAGQDLRKWNLNYSHMGFVWRDHPNGRWIVVHQLNHCGRADSDLFNEGLGNFFLDDPFRYEALVLVPGRAMQQRLQHMLAGSAPQRLHQRSYNMLAYPFSTQYQNSNQCALELFATASAADLAIGSREQAHAWLQAAGFRPHTAEIDALTRLGARMTRANIAFDDHPFERRMAGQIDVVSVESVYAFVQRRDPEHRLVRVVLH
jgi:hypothetical protein